MLKYLGIGSILQKLQKYSTFSEYNVLKHPYFSQWDFATMGNLHNLATISFQFRRIILLVG